MEHQWALGSNVTATYDIGSTALGVNDIHMSSGGIINFNNGDVLVSHTADTYYNWWACCWLDEYGQSVHD